MKVSKETIIRTIILVAALVNQILTASGKSPLPLADETLSQLISVIFATGASTWAWWKNNSFTPEAIEADEYLSERKKENEK